MLDGGGTWLQEAGAALSDLVKFPGQGLCLVLAPSRARPLV